MFKIGDKVICIEEPLWGDPKPVFNHSYTVAGFHSKLPEIVLAELPNSGTWRAERFKLAAMGVFVPPIAPIPVGGVDPGLTYDGTPKSIGRPEYARTARNQSDSSSGLLPYLRHIESPKNHQCQCGQKGVEWAKHSDYCPLYVEERA